jgi:hypothetical protein
VNRAALERLGLTVTERDGLVEAELELTSGQAMNPLTRQQLPAIRFAVMGDQLLYCSPPELVGSRPVNVAHLSPTTRLEDVVVDSLITHLTVVERRSTELSALGVQPRVEPTTLELSATLDYQGYQFVIGSNRSGAFRVLRASRDGQDVATPPDAIFELGEFRDRRALEELLFALVDDGSRVLAADGLPEQVPSSIPFRDIYEAFGDAQLPPRSALELVADVRVGDRLFRFACGRVHGRTFRGLLAGTSGKLWAERFELDDFPGIRGLVAEVVGVGIDEVEIL